MIENHHLLVVRCMDDRGSFYVFPGGGQEHGETLEEAVQRECLEETGATVKVGDLRFIREYIGKNHEFTDLHEHIHQVEFFFNCTLLNKQEAILEDDHQVGIEWIPLESIETYRIYPKELIKYLVEGNPTVYLGDIN